MLANYESSVTVYSRISLARMSFLSASWRGSCHWILRKETRILLNAIVLSVWVTVNPFRTNWPTTIRHLCGCRSFLYYITALLFLFLLFRFLLIDTSIINYLFCSPWHIPTLVFQWIATKTKVYLMMFPFLNSSGIFKVNSLLQKRSAESRNDQLTLSFA